MDAAEFLIPIAFFAMLFGILYIFFQTRNRERLALIEKGADASIFNHDHNYGKYKTLKFGMLSVGVALGIIVGFYLSSSTPMQEETAITAMIFLFGGASLVLNHLIERRLERQDKGGSHYLD